MKRRTRAFAIGATIGLATLMGATAGTTVALAEDGLHCPQAFTDVPTGTVITQGTVVDSYYTAYDSHRAISAEVVVTLYQGMYIFIGVPENGEPEWRGCSSVVPPRPDPNFSNPMEVQAWFMNGGYTGNPGGTGGGWFPPPPPPPCCVHVGDPDQIR